MFITKRLNKNKIIFQSDFLLQENFFNFFLISSNSKEIEEDLELIFKGNTPDFYVLKQIHSDKIIIPEKEDVKNFHTEGDGLIMHKGSALIGVKGADCYPVLLADIKNRNIGAIHCGWRGIRRGIIENAIDNFAKMNSKLSNIFVFVGPGICEGCYEVGKEIIEEFKGEDVEEPFYTKVEDKFYLDPGKLILIKLLKLGINIKNIEFLSLCTKCSYNFLPSYRRDRSSDRIFAFIGNLK